MTLLSHAYFQLSSYSFAGWIVFIVVTVLAARIFRWPGVFLGQALVALAVAALDVRWIQSEIHKQGWNGQPDQDLVFMIGVLVRIVLINAVLLPVAVVAMRWGRHKKQPAITI